ERDPLAELLAAPGPVDAEAVRRSLLAETTRRLRRPRRLRFAVLAAALAACYVAGLLTMYLLRPAPAAPVVVSQARPRGPAPTPVPPPTDPPAVARKTPEPPEPSERAALLRQQGDHYLNDENDPESALHSYTQALNAGTPDDAKFSPEDNWLL